MSRRVRTILTFVPVRSMLIPGYRAGLPARDGNCPRSMSRPPNSPTRRRAIVNATTGPADQCDSTNGRHEAGCRPTLTCPQSNLPSPSPRSIVTAAHNPCVTNVLPIYNKLGTGTSAHVPVHGSGEAGLLIRAHQQKNQCYCLLYNCTPTMPLARKWVQKNPGTSRLKLGEPKSPTRRARFIWRGCGSVNAVVGEGARAIGGCGPVSAEIQYGAPQGPPPLKQKS